MNDTRLEADIRAALAHRAGTLTEPRTPAPVARRRAGGRRLVAAGTVAASLVAVVALAAVTTGGGGGTGQVVVAAPADPGTAPVEASSAGQLPRLGFDPAGFRFASVEECSAEDLVPHDGQVPPGALSGPYSAFQAYEAPGGAGPLLFLATVRPDAILTPGTEEPAAGFEPLSAATGEPVQVRGGTGYASSGHSPDAGWHLDVVLPDGRAIAATVLGLDLAEVVSVLDGLREGPAGRWQATALPAGLEELPPSGLAAEPACYGATGDLPDDAAGAFEVDLYSGPPFDQRLADRVSSTEGQVQPVRIDGVAATIGSYAPDDHWVMLEPVPGRTLEIRAQDMGIDDVRRIASHARFVDEAAWRAMVPPG